MSEKKLETMIREAAKLHGHLGPFLVIGVRMGTIANRILTPAHNGSDALQVSVRVPLRTPYSCVLDGIQSTTRCTVGNQKLKVEDSQGEITAAFTVQGSEKTLIISTNPGIIGEIENEFSRGAPNKQVAAKIASAREDELFELERQ